MLALLSSILPESSTYYGILMGVGLLLGVYAHAARMPRLVAFAIVLVLVVTLMTMIAARTMDGDPGVPLP